MALPQYGPSYGFDVEEKSLRAEVAKREVPWPSNIHNDPRVARGANYGRFAARPAPPSRPEGAVNKQIMKMRRKARLHRAVEAAQILERLCRDQQPTNEVDLSAYLVESAAVAARPAVRDASSQSDAFHPEPPSPPFLPRQTGVDAASQVADLFDFDAEVEPLLDVLVSKTLEQARVEAEEEGEMQALLAAAEAAAAARREEAAAVAAAESAAVQAVRGLLAARKERLRLADARGIALAKVGCKQMARQLWPELLDRAHRELVASGAWKSPARREIESVFLPWLLAEVSARAAARATAQATIAAVWQTVETNIAVATEKAEAERAAKAAAKRNAEGARVRAYLRVAALGLTVPEVAESASELNGDGAAAGTIGPVDLRAGDTVQDAEVAIRRWLGDRDIGFVPAVLRAALVERVGGSLPEGAGVAQSSQPSTLLDLGITGSADITLGSDNAGREMDDEHAGAAEEDGS